MMMTRTLLFLIVVSITAAKRLRNAQQFRLQISVHEGVGDKGCTAEHPECVEGKIEDCWPPPPGSACLAERGVCCDIAHARNLREQQKSLLSNGPKEKEKVAVKATRHNLVQMADPQEKEKVAVKATRHNLVQMADPQLGMENLDGKKFDVFLDWKAEKKMLHMAAEGIQALIDGGKLSKDTEVIVHGDMQNWYPCDGKASCDETYKNQIGSLSAANSGGKPFLQKFIKELDDKTGEPLSEEAVAAKLLSILKKHDEAVAAKLQSILEKHDKPEKPEKTGKEAEKKKEELPKKKQEELGIGAWQTEDAKDALQALKNFDNIRYLPGNHDVGDNPNAEGLAEYGKKWGPNSVKQYFTLGKVGFIVLNSQVMQSDTPFARDERTKQFDWLDEQMKAIQGKGLKGLVLMMHIPPFMIPGHKPKEGEGWANVLKIARSKLRDIIFKADYKLVPQLIICGHFHNNVINEFPISAWAGEEGAKGLVAGLEKHKMELVVTSAVGARMDWGGEKTSVDGVMQPIEAQKVACLKNGAAAFFQKIMDNDIKDGWKNIKTRIGATKEKSGVRIFEFSDDGYAHEWVTVGKLKNFAGLEKATLTPWNPPRGSKAF